MEESSGDDKSFNHDKQQNPTRKFYNGQETSSPSEGEDIPTVGAFTSNQRTRRRGARRYPFPNRGRFVNNIRRRGKRGTFRNRKPQTDDLSESDNISIASNVCSEENNFNRLTRTNKNFQKTDSSGLDDSEYLSNNCGSRGISKPQTDVEFESDNVSIASNLTSASDLFNMSTRVKKNFQENYNLPHQEFLPKGVNTNRQTCQRDDNIENGNEFCNEIGTGKTDDNESDLVRSPFNSKPQTDIESELDNLNIGSNLNSDLFNKSTSLKNNFQENYNLHNWEFLPKSVNTNRQTYRKDASAEYGNRFCNESGTGETDDDDPYMVKVNTYKKMREEYLSFSQSFKPSEIIMASRREIEKMSNFCIANNLKNIDQIKSMMTKNEAYIPIFELHEKNLKLQQKEFEIFVTKAKQEINSIQYTSSDDLINKTDHIKRQTENECTLFQKTLPAYGFKSHILNAVKANQVVIVSSDCSYFFNLVTPVIIQSTLTNHFIISYESNNLASKYVKDKFNGIVKNSIENFPKINYVTDDELLRILSNSTDGNLFSEDLLLKKKEFGSKSFIAILNLPLKRSINLDLSLAFLRDLLCKQKDSILILLISRFDCTERYQKYFSEIKTDVLKLPKLLLPVKTMWKREASKNYKEDVVSTALSIHILNSEGDVLIFLPNEDEAKICVALFHRKLQGLDCDNIECVLLKENSPVFYFSSSSNPDKRIIFFTTHIAEVMPIPSVRYVIDCGLKLEYIYDKQKNLDILKTEFCSRAKARLRKSLPCVYKSGICYRIYNKEIFCKNMKSFERPDILTLNPFNSLIKIFQHAPIGALSVEFIEPLNDAVKYNTVKELRNFNAIKNGKLTPLGEKIVKLPLPTKYSKIIHQCIGWGCAYEAVVIVAYFSTDLFLFKYSKDEASQQAIDAVKLNLMQHESDAISFLNIYKVWIQNDCSKSWCDQFHINWNTLNEIQMKVLKICQDVYRFAGEIIQQEFKESEDLASDLITALLHSFSDHFCVFSGHYRSGYRILSTSQTAFLHPSSMLHNNKENPPQFLVFNKIICSSRNFLVGITAIPPEVVHTDLTNSYDKILVYDYSDIFEKLLVKKTIEPVGERIIKQVLLGKKGGKLSEIEDSVKSALKTGSIVIEPVVEKGCVDVYALESHLDGAVEMVQQILKNNVNEVINAEQVHILELKKGEITVPLEVRCVMGAKIISVEPKTDSHDNSTGNSLGIGKISSNEKKSSVQFSLNLTWVRRPCNGICYITFDQDDFKAARKLATTYISLLGNDVYVEVSKKADNQLLWADVPSETRMSDIEDALKKRLPRIKGANIHMMFSKPFETSSNEVSNIKTEIQEICEEFTKLSLYEICVPKPKNAATIWTAYINVYCTEDLTIAAEELSNVLINNYKIDAKPVYRSIINTSFKAFKALESRFLTEINDLKVNLTCKFPGKDLFTFEAINIDQDLVHLKLLSNDIQIMKQLQRIVNQLLEGEILDKNAVPDINKIFCHGGHMWLRTLETYKNVYILEEYNSKIVRVYGSHQNCFKVKKAIINFLEDTENDAVDTIVLNDDNNNRALLKAVIKNYGVNLESFIDLCKLRSAVLDIKSNRLILRGSREDIDKAKEVLDELSGSLDTTREYSLLGGGEMCPVCASPAFNLTFRLQHCNHLYCRECILGLVMQANFPIQCCAENCSEDVVLDDIVRILDEDGEKIKELLRQSLTEYIERNRTELIDCPAPDCPMFFKKKDISQRLSCPLCLNDICTSCNVVYHHGYTCDVFKGTKTDVDYSLKVYQQNVSNDCKTCPKCKAPIQRTYGCDHMTCGVCTAHFCWVCLRDFPRARDVYNHIPFCDKHPKW